MTWASIWTKWVVPWVLQMAQTMQFYSDVPSLPPLIYLPANVWKWSCSDGAVYECGDTMSPHKHSVCHSAAQSCPTLCDPMACSTPGFSVLHQLPELAQTHVHWVGDVIQPSHPLPSPSPPAFNFSQHQGLFQWIGSSHQVVKVLELQLLINIHNSFPLGLTGLISYSTYCHPIYQDLTPCLSGFWH